MSFSYADRIRGASCRQLLTLVENANTRIDELAKKAKTMNDHLRVVEESRQIAEQLGQLSGLISTEAKKALPKKKTVRIVYKDMDPIKELR